MKNFLLIIIILSNISYSQNSVITFPDNFIEENISVLENASWNLNYPPVLNSLEYCGNIITVRENLFKNETRMTSLREDFGLLFGINDGELKGGFYHKAKGNVPVLIKDGNITLLHRTPKDEIAYFYSKRGNLYKFEHIYKDIENGKLITEEIADIQDLPLAYVYVNDILVVAGIKNLYMFDNNEFKSLFHNNEWKNIYCYSILKIDLDTILIGIQSGILKINLSTKKMNLFIKR